MAEPNEGQLSEEYLIDASGRFEEYLVFEKNRKEFWERLKPEVESVCERIMKEAIRNNFSEGVVALIGRFIPSGDYEKANVAKVAGNYLRETESKMEALRRYVSPYPEDVDKPRGEPDLPFYQ
jgi:hypothetical protein